MTAVRKPSSLLSIEDYLAGEERADIKHEYLGGVVHACSIAAVCRRAASPWRSMLGRRRSFLFRSWKRKSRLPSFMSASPSIDAALLIRLQAEYDLDKAVADKGRQIIKEILPAQKPPSRDPR
jgi:hypothetical protein